MRTEGSRREARRGLFWIALVPAVFGVLHHLDHIVRGATGWPLIPEVTPFTYSLGLYLVIIPGLILGRRGLVGAGFWAIVATTGLAVVAPVHFGPVADDSLGAICSAYDRRVLPTAVAYAVLAGLIGGLVWLLFAAVRVRRVSGRW